MDEHEDDRQPAMTLRLTAEGRAGLDLIVRRRALGRKVTAFEVLIREELERRGWTADLAAGGVP